MRASSLCHSLIAAAVAAAALLAFPGCEKNSDSSRSPVSIDPDSVDMQTGGTSNVTLTADGGLPPYIWEVSDDTLGTVATSGDSAATTTAIYSRTGEGGQNIVTATDANDYEGTAIIYQDYTSKVLTIDPDNATLTQGGTSNVIFEAQGGGEPYTWSVTDSSLGAVAGSSEFGIYTRTDEQGENFVTVEDANGNTASATVLQEGGVESLTISPTTASLTGATSNKVFEAADGTAPYTWSVSDATLGSLAVSAEQAIYTRTALGGSSFVTVTDANGQSASATVTQTATLKGVSVTPTVWTFTAGTATSNKTFQASGGVTPYTWSLEDATYGTLISSGVYAIYTRATQTGLTSLTVTDSAGSSATATVIQE